MQTPVHGLCSAWRHSPLFIAFIPIAFLLSCTGKAQEGPLLDDRVFTVITMQNGMPADAMLERIAFSGGKFDNDNCHLWGFGDGAYTAKKEGNEIHFTATTTSAREGTMEWKGTVQEDVLSGEMVWKKSGQDDMHYTFSSKNIETTDLDGRNFTVTFTPADSATIEIITFNNGMLESPGCYAWGFSASSYDAYLLDGTPHFQCIYTSANEGTMLFYGTITDGKLSGTQFWTKPGQADNYYAMNGTEN